MARWKLMASHYLNVPGEEWEYTENDRISGRPKRHRFPVPRLLDVKDPTCWTNKYGNTDNEEGEITVCHAGKGEPTDITFIGDPTPHMLPMDDEAREISARFEKRWATPVENAAIDHSQSLIDKFQAQMAEVQSRPAEVPGLSELTAAINSLVQVNQKVLEGRRI